MRNILSHTAQAFDAAAVLHREIATRLLTRLDLMRMQPQLIVELNCATGYCTQLLQKRYHKAQVIGSDNRIAMLKFAKNKTNWLNLWSNQQRFVAANMATLPIVGHSVDLLIANLFAFPADAKRSEVAELLREWQRLLKPGGLLMFSTVGPDTLLELRQSWAKVDNYSHIHSFLDMHDIGDELLQTGFSDPVMDRDDFTLTYEAVQGLLQDLHHLDVQNTAANRRRGLTTKSTLTAVNRAYESFRTPEGRLPANIEIVYAHAWAPEIKQLSIQNETQIPVSAIKGLLKNSR